MKKTTKIIVVSLLTLVMLFTGITASATKRYEYIRWSNKGNRYIIEDDFESEFSVSTKSEETLFSLASQDNVIYLNTFSKTISPSLRVGYMVLPKKLVKVFEEKLGFYSCTVPTFEQHVIARLLQNGDFERHINRVRRHKRKEMQTADDMAAEANRFRAEIFVSAPKAYTHTSRGRERK